jgi:short-subunit dehydrogenase
MSKLVLVTGATDGIGKMTAQRLAAAGFEVIVHGRDQERVDHAIAEIKKQTSATLHTSVFDLSSLAEVKSGALDLLTRFPKLDVLLNNAGTYQKERRLSKDGFELTMAINHLGPTLLTLLLKPSLKSCPGARVIFVSSIAHHRGQLRQDNYNFEISFGAYEAYATSKLANVIATRKLTEAWNSDNIPIYSLHPGVITTKLLKIGFNVTGDSVHNGSNTSVYLATADLPAEFNGGYFVDSRSAPVSALARNKLESDAFWAWTMASLQPFLPK